MTDEDKISAIFDPMRCEDFIAIYSIASPILLAILGAWATLKPPQCQACKMILLTIFIVLGLTAIAAAVYARTMDSNERALSRQQLDKILEQVSYLPPPVSANTEKRLQRLEQIAAGEEDTNKKAKAEAQLLSGQILKFLADRGSPANPAPETWDRDVKEMLNFYQETMNQYSSQFAVRVIATRDKLAELGLVDEELDKFYEHPTNLIGVRIVGERIGALAYGIP